MHRAAKAEGVAVENCGALPTPALALRSLTLGIPAIMVTGSHIPADRNGLKFYRAEGEIDKADEAGIVAAWVDPPGAGQPAAGPAALPVDPAALDAYLARMPRPAGAGCLPACASASTSTARWRAT